MIRVLGGLLAFLVTFIPVSAQPVAVESGVRFTYGGTARSSVALVGDFNGWSKQEDRLLPDVSGSWNVTRKISPGIFQYKFLVDDEEYVLDPGNPAIVENYNKSGFNSVFVYTPEGALLLTSETPAPSANPSDHYPPTAKKPVYLNIIWHQHQPLYVDPAIDQLRGPWVRTHATKDYYDMTAMLEGYPAIHCNVNLTSSLLYQLQEYYVERLGPFVDRKKNRVDTEGFLKKWAGKTDPWIDLALKSTGEFTTADKDHMYRNSWNAFGISEVMIARFPEYAQLQSRMFLDIVRTDEFYTEQQLRELKFWFFLAHFDPDFFAGPVKLPDGSVCDLSDLIERRSGDTFHLRKSVTEEDCNRIVAEAYKVMANVVPLHKKMMYHPERLTGQVEVITTPFYHPILPLIYDSDLARTAQPGDPLPARFSYPADAEAQIIKAVQFYKKTFGVEPRGMWPGEGAVAQPVLEILRKNGILWTASDANVLRRSRPAGKSNTTAFSFPAGDAPIALVFRDTELSDRIGFKYQSYKGEEAAEDFVQSVLSFASDTSDEDILITVILDGENAWEWYRHDIDAKEFLHAFYRKLSRLYELGHVITTTTSEYISGNPNRGIAPHPPEKLPRMEWLHPGSWINASYDTWIGEEEENVAWTYLFRAREDLKSSGIPAPDPRRPAPTPHTKNWFDYMAWEAMYAAEGSDWFWWYGSDQSAPAGDEPFDIGFRTHLENTYTFAQKAGSRIQSPGFDPILKSGRQGPGQGTMARGAGMQSVILVCDATAEDVRDAIYVVGNLRSLGEWTPNVVRMYDDGTHGDEQAGDGRWSLLLEVAVGEEIQYKYTNSGERGSWVPGEEFPTRNRVYSLLQKSADPIILRDTFGK